MPEGKVIKIYTVKAIGGINREVYQLIEGEAKETACYFMQIKGRPWITSDYTSRIDKKDHYRSPEAALRHFMTNKTANLERSRIFLAQAEKQVKKGLELADKLGFRTTEWAFLAQLALDGEAKA